ncbi:MAG: hypothetical protein E7269_08025 [Lachnospiraceae bacterium]|nr:hypothetical protein [Lachnospiraceae bacterium]
MLNTKEEAMQLLAQTIESADMVLVGIGKEWSGAESDVYQALSEVIDGKNYFVLTTIGDVEEAMPVIREDRILSPEEDGYAPEKWERYTKWLTGTMNRNLVLLELGVLFDHPEIIRWPFERIAYLSKKSKLFRINNSFPQLTEQLQETAVSVKINSKEFIKEMSGQA